MSDTTNNELTLLFILWKTERNFLQMKRYSQQIITLLVSLLSVILFFGGAGSLSIRDHFRLVDEESKLIDTLRKYIHAEDARLNKLQNFRNLLMQNDQLYANEDEFAWNPLAIYKTIKHLTVDLDEMNKEMRKNAYDDIVPKIFEKENVVLPKNHHLYVEINNLVLLQSVQNMTVNDIMDGHLLHNTTGESVITVEDCFLIGSICAEHYDYDLAAAWLSTCSKKKTFDKDTQKKALTILTVSYLYTGEKALALEAVGEVLLLDRDERVLIDLTLKLSEDLASWNENTTRHYMSLKACAGDYEKEVAARNIKCRYNHHNSPFLIIAPLKEEVLSIEPKISFFPEAVYDSEIELLIDEAMDSFGVARVIRDGERTFEVRYRSNQVAFLFDEWKKPELINFRCRLSDMSGLSLNYRERIQMLRYAPGGFYRVHPDFIRNCTSCEAVGNRVATTLMYLNNVTLGGHTVFPDSKLTVQPIKGSAVFFLDMLADGTEEVRNQHAACPVIYGEKFAGTQWYRGRGQDRWIAEPEDDKVAHYSMNLHSVCPKRTTRKRNATS